MSELHSKHGTWFPCDYRLMNAMAVGVDRTINPGEVNEILPGTPVEDFRTAALAVGCTVRRARKLMGDRDFLNDLQAAKDHAAERQAEGAKHIEECIETRGYVDDLDEIYLSDVVMPKPVPAFTRKEWREQHPREQHPRPSAGYVMQGYASIAEEDAARELARERAQKKRIAAIHGEPYTADPPMPEPKRKPGEVLWNVSTLKGTETRVVQIAGSCAPRKSRPPRWSLTARRL